MDSLTIDDLMAQQKGKRNYRITITSSKTRGVFWNYDEPCSDFSDALRVANELVQKHHISQDSWQGRLTKIEEL